MDWCGSAGWATPATDPADGPSELGTHLSGQLDGLLLVRGGAGRGHLQEAVPVAGDELDLPAAPGAHAVGQRALRADARVPLRQRPARGAAARADLDGDRVVVVLVLPGALAAVTADRVRPAADPVAHQGGDIGRRQQRARLDRAGAGRAA